MDIFIFKWVRYEMQSAKIKSNRPHVIPTGSLLLTKILLLIASPDVTNENFQSHLQTHCFLQHQWEKDRNLLEKRKPFKLCYSFKIFQLIWNGPSRLTQGKKFVTLHDDSVPVCFNLFFQLCIHCFVFFKHQLM